MYHADPFGRAWIELSDSGEVDDIGGAQYRRYRHEWERSEIIQPLTPREWILSTLDLERLILAHIGRLEAEP